MDAKFLTDKLLNILGKEMEVIYNKNMWKTRMGNKQIYFPLKLTICIV